MSAAVKTPDDLEEIARLWAVAHTLAYENRDKPAAEREDAVWWGLMGEVSLTFKDRFGDDLHAMAAEAAAGVEAEDSGAAVLVADAGPKIPPPLGISEVLGIQDPEHAELITGLIQAASNVLIAGGPKSHKTNAALEMAVSLATASAFLGHFHVPRAVRVGIVLMEGAKHRLRRRLERICQAHDVDPHDLDGGLFVWFRPPLRLADAVAMGELAAYVAEYELDVLIIDNWSYVSSGDSNSADEVQPQLDALGNLRRSRDGLTVVLLHHTRKITGDREGERVTDMIRNSSAFGGWYDAGLLLTRTDESAPVKVRAELRDLPSPEPFWFVVQDECAGNPAAGIYPSGYLRLRVTDKDPAVMELDAQAARLKPAIAEYLAAHPGCSKRSLREGVQGENRLVEAAFRMLVREGAARFDPPAGKGKPGHCWPTVPDRAVTVPPAHPGDRADRAAPPIGGAVTAHPRTGAPTSPRHGPPEPEGWEFVDAEDGDAAA